MNPKDLARIELEARRLRAAVFADMIRALFHRAPRVGATAPTAARTA